MGLEVGRTARFYEACPLRHFGRVDDAELPRIESELALEVRAHESLRQLAAPKAGVA
jgi:hypothetical protein